MQTTLNIIIKPLVTNRAKIILFPRGKSVFRQKNIPVPKSTISNVTHTAPPTKRSLSEA